LEEEPHAIAAIKKTELSNRTGKVKLNRILHLLSC